MFSLDPELPRDVAQVLESASVLDVSEYRVFELAYRARFGGPVRDTAAFDRCFFDYLYRDRVPPWVRAFTRAVVDRAHEAGFDPVASGLAPPVRPAAVSRGIRYAVWTAVTVAAIVFAAHFSADPSGCMFPPCY